MHPDVCAFVSERSYDGAPALAARVRSAARSTRRGALTGAGLRALAVEHEGRSQASPEEAEAIAAACRDLLAGATVTDDEGRDARARRRRHPRRRALQPRRALHPRPRARRRPRRHRRPLPGPGGARRLLRDDVLLRRGRAARARLPLRRPPPQRRGLARAVPRGARPQPAAARRRLPHARGDGSSSTASAGSWSSRRRSTPA